MLLDWHALTVEPDGITDFGPCPDCGNMSRTVWGYVRMGDETLAAYYVTWTQNMPRHSAHFELIIGKWTEDSTAQDRQVAALAYRIVDGQGSFMVIDPSQRPEDANLASSHLRRDQVVGKPIADIIFAIVDAVYMKDP